MKYIILKIIAICTLLVINLTSFGLDSFSPEMLSNKLSFSSQQLTTAKTVDDELTDDEIRELLVSQSWLTYKQGINFVWNFYRNGHFRLDISERRFGGAKAYALGNWRVSFSLLCLRFYEQSNPLLNLVDGEEYCSEVTFYR